MRGGARAFLPDPAPCALAQRALCRKGPRGSRRVGPSAKGTPLWDPTSGRVEDCADSWSRTLMSAALDRCDRTPPPGAAPPDQRAARATRRAVARQPDQAQRRLPQELREARPGRHRLRSDRHARGRRRQSRVEPRDRVAQAQHRHRSSRPAGTTRRGALAEYIMAAVAERAGSASLRRHRGPATTSCAGCSRPQRTNGCRQGAVRRAGPDLRRRVPPGTGAGGARKRCTSPPTDPRVEGRASRG